eukprot:Sspe_Gene.91510::Locus_63017_Transcript_1_1_Confidence_1.000_Length_2729::g.91510::m.91510
MFIPQHSFLHQAGIRHGTLLEQPLRPHPAQPQLRELLLELRQDEVLELFLDVSQPQRGMGHRSLLTPQSKPFAHTSARHDPQHRLLPSLRTFCTVPRGVVRCSSHLQKPCGGIGQWFNGQCAEAAQAGQVRIDLRCLQRRLAILRVLPSLVLRRLDTFNGRYQLPPCLGEPRLEVPAEWIGVLHLPPQAFREAEPCEGHKLLLVVPRAEHLCQPQKGGVVGGMAFECGQHATRILTLESAVDSLLVHRIQSPRRRVLWGLEILLQVRHPPLVPAFELVQHVGSQEVEGSDLEIVLQSPHPRPPPAGRVGPLPTDSGPPSGGSGTHRLPSTPHPPPSP